MVLGFVAAGALIALFYWTAIWCGEPRYKGRTLTHWLAVYQNASLDSRKEREEQEAADAVRHIGAKALPYLIARLAYYTPSWRLKVERAARQLPGPAGRWVSSLMTGKEDHVVAALNGFYLLGAEAAPAVPELIGLLRRKETWDIATMALQEIGEAGIPDLTAVLTNRANPSRVRVGAARVLGDFGTNSSAVVLLANCLGENPLVAEEAAAALGKLHLEPAIAVPALVKAAENGPIAIREQAISSLGRFGTNARPAVDVLTNFFTDPEPLIRETTTNTLEVIAPETLDTNAAVISNQ
jgi:hypothetical protein